MSPVPHPKNVLLVSPETKKQLEIVSLAEADDLLQQKLPRTALRLPLSSESPVLINREPRAVYPIVEGVPVLLEPERLDWNAEDRAKEQTRPIYREAYEEMSFYNGVGTDEASSIASSEAFSAIAPIAGMAAALRAQFPYPPSVWLDAVYDCSAQQEAYEFLKIGPLTERVIQLGGKGIHAVKFLLAGASEAWLITPMLGEAICSLALARFAGVADRLRCVVAVGERLPLPGQTVDAVYSGGCLHHMIVEEAAGEIARVLRPTGRFAAVDPWRTPLYRAGIAVFGKREAHVRCKPLTSARVQPIFGKFGEVTISKHGALTRYPLLALNKLRLSVSLNTSLRITAADDQVSAWLHVRNALGSSAVICGNMCAGRGRATRC